MSDFYKVVLGWFGRARNLQMLALILCGPVFTIVSLLYLWVAWKGPWEPGNQELQLQIIRDGVMWVHVLLFLAISALTAGLVRSIKLNIADKVEFMVDLADDLDTPSNIAETAMSISADTVEEAKDVSSIPPEGS